MANTQAQLQKLFTRAATSLQNGDIPTARKRFLQLARKIPQSTAVHYNLGLCYQHLQQHDAAITSFNKVLTTDKNHADAWTNLGISHKASGNIDKAREAADEALRLQPRHPRALNLAGSIDAELGQVESARQLLQQSLAVAPNYVDALCNLANIELEHGNPDQADRLITPALQHQPQNRELRLLQAKRFIAQKAFNNASPLVHDLMQEFPDDEEVIRLNLSFRECMRDHFGVIDIAEKLLQRIPDDADSWNSLGCAYFQLDSIDKSMQCYQKAVDLEPENAEYENNLGLAYASLGNKKNADKHYRRALTLNPLHAEAYRNIATMKKFQSMDDADAQQALALYEKQDLDDFTRIKAAFALGKMYDDCGLHAAAFATYKVGNELKFHDSNINLDDYFAHIDSVAEVLDAPPEHCNQTPITPAPIFVLGMPRSGTTLIEQVLSRHSQVAGYGELPCIERAISRLERQSTPMKSYPGDFHTVTATEFAREAKEYLHWVHRLHQVTTPYFTDKMPFNFVHIWLIKAMFPRAPIINCRRHPLDVIISNYFQLYGSDISFVYDLDALTDYYLRYHRLMEHWHRVFAGQLIDVTYEKFVAESEPETRRLIEAVELPWEDRCLEQQTTNTAVRTASIWQVRRGIYTSSRERWRNYQPYLQEVIAKLADRGILEQDGDWIAQ